jgi:formylglycine-generating enzyme required for sulfatase activity
VVNPDRKWFVSKTGHTFSVIPKGELTVPGPQGPRTLAVDHPFAIGTKEVTWAEWAKHMPLPTGREVLDHPVDGVTWYQMAEFCNKLNAVEGVPESEWCYRPNKDGKYDHGMEVLNPRTHSGYRLPTREEWEFAARADATTPWHCGRADDALLVHYAWYRLNAPFASPVPSAVGRFKPNDRGLFDVHGNVLERGHPYHTFFFMSLFGGAPLPPDRHLLDDNVHYVFAYGGKVSLYSEGLQIGQQTGGPPSSEESASGLRIARTEEGR